MSQLDVVAGFCGKGEASYDAGEFTLPGDHRRFAEDVDTVATHGGVYGRRHWSDPVVNGLRGGLALASNLELSGPLSLAAGALGAGLATLNKGDTKPRTLIDITFADGTNIVALTDEILPALLLNDREVVRRAASRRLGAPSPESHSMIEAATDSLQQTGSAAVAAISDAASSALSGAYSLFRPKAGKP